MSQTTDPTAKTENFFLPSLSLARPQRPLFLLEVVSLLAARFSNSLIFVRYTRNQYLLWQNVPLGIECGQLKWRIYEIVLKGINALLIRSSMLN